MLTLLAYLLGFFLFLGTIAFVSRWAIQRFGWTQWVLNGIIWGLRMRFGILVMFGPILLWLGAAYLNPKLLLGLLLVRRVSSFFDLFVITWMSFFTTALGILIIRFLWCFGRERFSPIDWRFDGELEPTPDEAQTPEGPEAKTPTSAPPGEGEANEGRRWSPLLVSWWVLVSLVLPCACLWTSMSEENIVRENVGWAVGGIVVGAVAAIVAAIGMAFVQRLTLGGIDGHSTSGMLPFESWFRNKKIPTWTKGNPLVWLFGTEGRGISWLLRGPGYTDRETGKLLPGQAQLLVVAFISMAAYLIMYFLDLRNDKWLSLNWPTIFFALLSLFVVGWFLASLAYWLDHYSVPVSLFALAWIFLIYLGFGVDHSFPLNHREKGKNNGKVSYFVPPGDPKLPEDEGELARNAYLKAMKIQQSADETLDQIYWVDALKNWKFPGEKGKRTLVIVTASGGGIQAAAWTAEVLSQLDKNYPGFSESVGLISCVSGGGVGTMFYYGHRGLRQNKGGTKLKVMLDDEQRDHIWEASTISTLEACGWGLAFPDLVRTIAPAAPRYVDRGSSLESFWWNKMAGNKYRRAMSEVSIRDLIPLVKDGLAPPVIYNATCVETGQRVSISPIHIEVSATKQMATAYREAGKTKRGEEYVSKPIDFLQFYDDALKGVKADPRISTAARLSASFSYVTPITLADCDQSCWREDEELRKRRHRHFCDGGYSDNTGLLMVIQMVDDLLQYYKSPDAPPAPFDQILIVRIEPFPARKANDLASGNNGFQMAFFGPATALEATRVSTQAERVELELRLLREKYDPLSRPKEYAREASDQVAALANELEQEGKAEGAEIVKQFLQTKKEFSRSFKQSAAIPDEILSRGKLTQQFEQTIRGLKGLEKELEASIKEPNKKLSTQEMAYLTKATETLKKGRTELWPGRGDPSEPEIWDLPTTKKKGIEVKAITFHFQSSPPPLSWTLSEKQKKAIQNEWKEILAGKAPMNESGIGSADNFTLADLGELFPNK